MGLGQFAYANNSNRFLAAAPLAGQRFALVGVPFDGAVTNRPGARFGPQEIRRASLMLCDAVHPFFGVSPLDVLGDGGDMRLPNATPLPDVRRAIESAAAALMAAHHCVFLGGDHSVTLPLLRAAHARFGLWVWCTLMPTAIPGKTISASLRGMEPGPMRRSRKA